MKTLIGITAALAVVVVLAEDPVGGGSALPEGPLVAPAWSSAAVDAAHAGRGKEYVVGLRIGNKLASLLLIFQVNFLLRAGHLFLADPPIDASNLGLKVRIK